MSGHSKWATIHRQKEKNDNKRGAAFTKLSYAITVAVREGGGIADPASNFKLRLAVDKARAVNMPKENIQRAIERASGAGATELHEAMYEGFLPGGAAVLVSTLSDNKMRSQQSVREAIEKSGGNIGSVGSVSYLFSQKGEVRFRLSNGSKSQEDQELQIIDVAGIEDLEDDQEGGWIAFCDKDQTFTVKDRLEAIGYTVSDAELSMKPLSLVEVADTELQTRIESILTKLSDLDDVQKVWTNYA